MIRDFGPMTIDYIFKFCKEIKSDEDKLIMEAILSNYDLIFTLCEDDMITKIYVSKLCDNGRKLVVANTDKELESLQLGFFEEKTDESIH